MCIDRADALGNLNIHMYIYDYHTHTHTNTELAVIETETQCKNVMQKVDNERARKGQGREG